MARFNLISNISNGVGLERDTELLRAELERRGHEVHPVHFKSPDDHRADVNVFLEVIEFMPRDKPEQQVPFARLAALAPRQWLVPNPEWFYVSWPLDVWDLVLTKTHDATRIFTDKVSERCQYLGWQANDFYDPAIPRETRFLHVRGKSQAKNTDAVRDGARRAGVALTVLDNRERRVSDDELRQLLNSHAFCLLPSAYEGYGHSLHEAMGCGQIVITTNAPPMNELQPALFVRPSEHRTHHCGVLHAVQGRHVAQTISRALALTDAERAEMSRQARATFEAERAQFQANLDRVLETHL